MTLMAILAIDVIFQLYGGNWFTEHVSKKSVKFPGYFLSNNNKISLCVAPCTFRIAISRYLCCMSNKDNPNKAIEDIRMAIKAKKE